MDWHQHVRAVLPHVVRIETPAGYGTGFLRHRQGEWFGVATARHVVEHAHKWEQPIKIYHESVQAPITLHQGERAIALHSELDVAMVAGRAGDGLAGWPATPMRLAPPDDSLLPGVAVGWLGYPHLVDDGSCCCFFSGSISAFRRHRYFVDGVAIQGVSGGPAFCTIGEGEDPDELIVIGSISEYRPNTAGGDTLPGLLVADDVSGLQSLHDLLRSALDRGEEL